jgi:hypothetical protein
MNIDNLVILTSLGCFMMVLVRYKASLKVKILSSDGTAANRVVQTGRHEADQR